MSAPHHDGLLVDRVDVGLGGSERHSLQAVELSPRSQTAVQIVSNLPAPSNRDPIYRIFFGQTGHVDPLDGWRCFSQKWVMSRLIKVRQHHINESGFVISAINKYMLGATGLNTECTSDAPQVSAKHNTPIPGPAICT